MKVPGGYRRLPFNYVCYDSDTNEYLIQPIGTEKEFVGDTQDGQTNNLTIPVAGITMPLITDFVILDRYGVDLSDEFVVHRFGVGVLDATSATDK